MTKITKNFPLPCSKFEENRSRLTDKQTRYDLKSFQTFFSIFNSIVTCSHRELTFLPSKSPLKNCSALVFPCTTGSTASKWLGLATTEIFTFLLVMWLRRSTDVPKWYFTSPDPVHKRERNKSMTGSRVWRSICRGFERKVKRQKRRHVRRINRLNINKKRFGTPADIITFICNVDCDKILIACVPFFFQKKKRNEKDLHLLSMHHCTSLAYSRTTVTTLT